MVRIKVSVVPRGGGVWGCSPVLRGRTFVNELDKKAYNEFRCVGVQRKRVCGDHIDDSREESVSSDNPFYEEALSSESDLGDFALPPVPEFERQNRLRYEAQKAHEKKNGVVVTRDGADYFVRNSHRISQIFTVVP